jgi:putative protease
MPKIKKAIKKPKPSGRITHYFGDIKVAVIKIASPLKVGDSIRIAGGEDTDFEQEIKSMQIDHKEIKLAKKGNSIGLKVKEKVREDYLVYKI